MERIGDGAEAIIYHDDGRVVKDRIEKRYRHKEIDRQLRKTRTRQEASILEKLEGIGFPSPRVEKMDDEKMLLEIEFVEGPQLKSVLEGHKRQDELSREVGRLLAQLHANDIIHGDLTTSNMILRDGKIVFIDFGLGFFSLKEEDKAVDLHLLKRALNSKHPLIAKKVFGLVLEEYKKEMGPAAQDVLTRLEKVEKRGRYKKSARKKRKR